MTAAWVAPLILFLLVVAAAWIGVRWARSEHLEALRAVPLFSLLSERELGAVLRSAQAIGFGSGANIITQGEQGKGAFVLTEGSAVVTTDGTEVATLGPGSYFGEMSVIDGGPRSATVTAKTQVSTLEISTAAFRNLVNREPMIAKGIQRELRRRLEAAGQEVDRDDDAHVDQAGLEEMCRTLRRTQDPDWVQTPTKHRSLRFSTLFARGSH